MSRAFAVAGGLLFVGSLAFFAASFGWRFTGDAEWSWRSAMRPAAIDLALFSIFALHHSIFARLGLRRAVARMAPRLERSIYVWIASALFIVVCAAWQPVPGIAWQFTGWPRVLFGAAQLAGGALALIAARQIDVLELAGVRQAFDMPDRSPGPALDRGPYALVRHPIYLGWFAMVWLPATMNGTRLIFAAVSCVYLILAIPFEERDLSRVTNGAYAAYAGRVKWKIVPGLY